jgi:aspartate/methionine/tyrosine aminotransferase
MRPNPFKLEKYLEKYEFKAKYILGASDCESFQLNDILSKKKRFLLDSKKLGYSQAKGNFFLRKEITKLSTCSKPEEVVVCAPQEGIFLVFNSLLKEGDRTIVQVPCYQSLCEIPKALGSEVIAWEPISQENNWKWEIEFLKEKVDKHTRLIVVNSPHNPTGFTFSRKEYNEILGIAEEFGCFVFSDEMYRLLEYNQQDRLPIGSDVYDNCVSLSGMSKTFGLGGLRIGWLGTKNQTILNRIMDIKDYTTISNNVLGEYVAMVALQKREKLLSRNRGIICNNLKVLDSFFSRYQSSFIWSKPKAGSVAFVKTIFSKTAEDFCEELVDQKSVLLVPRTEFNYGNNHFRLGFGRQNLPEGLKLLEDYVLENRF